MAGVSSPIEKGIVLMKSRAKNGEPQQSNEKTLVAEIGSLFLEFTKLSQITGDSKYYDAVARVADVFEKAQNKTKMPGMWPISVNPQLEDLGGDTSFTIGAMADSLYEYFPKVCLFHYVIFHSPRLSSAARLGGLVACPHKTKITSG